MALDYEQKVLDNLDKAIAAEAAGGKKVANSAFRMAAFCDHKARGGDGSAKEYSDSVGDVL